MRQNLDIDGLIKSFKNSAPEKLENKQTQLIQDVKKFLTKIQGIESS